MISFNGKQCIVKAGTADILIGVLRDNSKDSVTIGISNNPDKTLKIGDEVMEDDGVKITDELLIEFTDTKSIEVFLQYFIKAKEILHLKRLENKKDGEPCPKCHSHGKLSKIVHWQNDRYLFMCSVCGFSGNFEDSEKEAMGAWNETAVKERERLEAKNHDKIK